MTSDRGRRFDEVGLAGLRSALGPGESLQFALVLPWAHGPGIRRLGLLGGRANRTYVPGLTAEFFLGLTVDRLLLYSPTSLDPPRPYQALDGLVAIPRAGVHPSTRKDWANLWLNVFYRLPLIALDTPGGTMYLGSKDPLLLALREALVASPPTS